MNKKYHWKQAIITGLIVGIFATVAFIVADSLNKHFLWGIKTTAIRGLIGLLTLVILAIGIYIGMQTIKRSNEGKLTYSQALFAGFIIALTTGIITAFVGLIYSKYINPGYTTYMLNESRKEMIADGKSLTEVTKDMTSIKQQWTVGAQILQALVGQIVCGTVIALITGLFVRSKK